MAGAPARKKILLYFMIGLVIPSILMGFLAFRGIQNDRLALDIEKKKQVREFSNKILAAIEDSISTVESQFVQLILPDHVPSSNALAVFSESHPSLSTLLCLENNTIRHFESKHLYWPYPEEAFVPNHSEWSASFEDAWQFEFQTKDYGKAYSYFESHYVNESDPYMKSYLLCSMARIAYKMKKIPLASTLYQRAISIQIAM